MFAKKHVRTIDDEINRLVLELKDIKPHTIKYATITTQLDGLYKMRSYKAESLINWDNWISSGTYLLGLVLVLKHEQLEVISSKAFGMLGKLRF